MSDIQTRETTYYLSIIFPCNSSFHRLQDRIFDNGSGEFGISGEYVGETDVLRTLEKIQNANPNTEYKIKWSDDLDSSSLIKKIKKGITEHNIWIRAEEPLAVA